MAFCAKCGNEIKDGEMFCGSCGAPVGQAEQATQAAGNDKFNDIKNQALGILNTKDTTDKYDKNEIEANKIKCAISYIPILFFLPLIICPKGSKYAKFHANQSLLLLIICVVLNIIGAVIGLIPILGTIIQIIFNLVVLGGIVFGIVFTAQGKVKELPFVGGIHIL